MQPSRVMGVRGDECQCGRRLSIRHCPACGSVRLYARMNRVHLMLDGSSKMVPNEFRCITCGHLFIDEEREWCEAPPVNQALAQQKLKAIVEASRAGEFLRPQDAKIADAVAQITQGQTQDPRKAYDLLIYHIRVEFADRRAAGEEDLMKISMAQFVEARLKELNIVPPPSEAQPEALKQKHVLDEPLALPKDELERDSIPVEERSIRLEWGRKKLAGRSLPDVEDYVRRRLAGELFND